MVNTESSKMAPLLHHKPASSINSRWGWYHNAIEELPDSETYADFHLDSGLTIMVLDQFCDSIIVGTFFTQYIISGMYGTH